MRGAIMLFLLVLGWGCDTANNTPNPAESFFLRYYGTDGDQESVDMVANENDGTFLLLGNSKINSSSNSQIYLVKVDALGFMIWEKFYGGIAEDLAVDIEPIANGNFVILANQKDNASSLNTDIFLRSVSPEGVQLDSGAFSYSGSTNEVGASVTPILDGTTPAGFIVAGNTDSPSDGSIELKGKTALFVRFGIDCKKYQGAWTDVRGEDKDDYSTKVVQVGPLSSADPFLIFGYTNSDLTNPAPTFNFWRSPLNSYGAGLFLVPGIVEGPPNTQEFLSSVTSTLDPAVPNKNFLLAGISSSGAGTDKIFMASISESRSIGLLKPQSISGIDLGNVLEQDEAKFTHVSASPAPDGSYVITATAHITGHTDIVVAKAGVTGTPEWDLPIVLGGANDDYSSAVHVLRDGRIMVFGTFQIGLGNDPQSKMALMKLNSKGELKD